jgi:hypothetical protein
MDKKLELISIHSTVDERDLVEEFKVTYVGLRFKLVTRSTSGY